MTRKTLPLISVLALGLSLSTAPALAGKHGHGKFMESFDSNGDGKVTLDEFNTTSADRFKKMDTNADGKLTEEEFSGYLQARREQRRLERFKTADTDKDGSVSKDEYLAVQRQRAERRFARMDRDSNGMLNAEEYARKRGHHNKKGGGKHIFTKLDSNNDGHATLEESQIAWDKWFRKMDTNGDNMVTSEEVKQAREKYRHRSER
jgi:Ca2+-binding EF-hand superfamily protein